MTTSTTLARWHDIFAARDSPGRDALLAAGVVFESPAVHTPQVGKALQALRRHAHLRQQQACRVRGDSRASG